MARILVAEDDDDIRDLVAFKLGRSGHAVVAVADGAAAVAACEADPPDLVLVDVLMPEMTGLDVVRRLRLDPALAEVPVIVLTAHAQQSDIEEGFRAGADEYLVKPFSPRDLASRVDSLLQRSRGK